MMVRIDELKACALKNGGYYARVATDDDQYGRRVTEKVTEKPLALEDRILAAIAEEPNLSQRELSEMAIEDFGNRNRGRAIADGPTVAALKAIGTNREGGFNARLV